MVRVREENKLSVAWYVPSLLCIALVGLCWIGIALILKNTRESQIAAEARHLHNVAMIFAEHAASTFGQADTMLRSLKNDVEADLASGIDSLRIERSKYGLGPQSRPVERLSLVNPRGQLVATSLLGTDTPLIDLSGRPHIRVHLDNPASGLHIGVPVISKLTYRWSLFLTRRINGPSGFLGGIATAAVDPAILSEMYGSVRLGDDAVIMLVGTDGIVRAKVGEDGKAIGRKLDSPVWRRLLASPPDRPTVHRTLMSSEKMIDVAPVMGYPLRVVVGLSKNDYLASYRLEERRLISIGAIATGLLSLAAILIAMLQLRSNAAFQSLVLVEQNNRLINSTLAVNNDRFQAMSEHLSIGLCMFDGSGNLVVCNDNFLKMYDLPFELRDREASFKEVVILCVDNGFWAVRNGDEGGVSEPTYWGRLDEEPSNRCVYDLVDGRSILVTRQRMNTGGWVFTHDDITEKRKKDRQIELLALSDSLTSLANRPRLLRELESMVGSEDRNFALLLLDLDHFKSVNDSLGHPVGDKLLIEVAERIKRTCREGDVVARLGGDEFAVIAKDLQAVKDASKLAARLIQEVSQPYLVASHELVIGVSIGIALAHSTDLAPEVLMQDADVALYRAKAEGRNAYRIFAQQMMLQVKQRRLLETELRTAAIENQFEPYFQPIVNTHDGRAVGYEALARWHHPSKGLVMPGEFIDAAEETGLIGPIGRQLFRQACQAMRRAPENAFLSINISPVQLRHNDFVERILKLLQEGGLEPDRAQIEITEAVVLRDDAITQHNLLALRHAGVRIAVDDFGMGYSSLSYLKEYPFDTVKIDKSFTSGVTDNGRGLAIVKAIVELAHAIGMDVTAEGVETEEQFTLLRSIGCSKVQGYLLGRPVPVDMIFAGSATAYTPSSDDLGAGKIYA